MLLCRRAPPGISSENNILMYVRIYRSFFLPLASSFPCFSSLSLSHPASNFSLTRNFLYQKCENATRALPFFPFTFIFYQAFFVTFSLLIFLTLCERFLSQPPFLMFLLHQERRQFGSAKVCLLKFEDLLRAFLAAGLQVLHQVMSFGVLV